MDDNSKKEESVFVRNEGDRIVYYRISSSEGANLWDGHWGKNITDLKEFYRRYLRGYLGYGQLREEPRYYSTLNTPSYLRIRTLS